MSDRLEQFLASEAAQGLFHEAGQFKLDPEKALEKISQFALPEPGLWVVKMLQAAVASEAPEIHFKFGKREVEVRFRNPGWEAETLLSQLLSALTPEEPALRHIFAGVLGAAMGFSQEITWRCGSSSVLVDKDGPRSQPEEHGGENFCLVAKRPRRSPIGSGLFSSPIRYLFKQTAQEYKSLIERSRVCPIPLFIDGRKVESSYQVHFRQLPAIPRYDSESSDGRRLFFAQIPLTGIGRLPISYPIDSRPLESVVTDQDIFDTLRLPIPENGPVEGVLCLHGCLQRQSRLNFVMDGGVISEKILFAEHEPFGLRDALEDGKDNFVLDLYLPVSWKELDLTQMGVREVDHAAIADMCAARLLPIFEELRDNCHHEWTIQAENQTPRDKPGYSAGDVLTGGFLSLFIPHMLFLGGILGGAYATYKVATAAGPLKSMETSLKAWAHRKQSTAFKTRMDQIIKALRKELDTEI